MAENSQQEFLKDLDINAKPDAFPEAPVTEEVSEDTGFEAKNRRERRLLTQNQRLREEAIASEARAQALSEVNKFREEVGDDTLKEVEAIFGTNTPEKLAATNILKKALSGMSEQAVQKALEKLEEREGNEAEAVRKEEDNIELMLERVEDDTDLDLSEGSPDRKAFLSMLEKASPKDRDGNIIEYADPDYVVEQFLDRKGKVNERNKNLSSRSMTRSGASQESKLEQSEAERYLKEHGII